MDSYKQRGQIRIEVRSDQKGGTKGHQNKMMKHNHVEGREKNKMRAFKNASLKLEFIKDLEQ